MNNNLDYYKILEALGDGVISINANNQIEYINDKAIDIVGILFVPDANIELRSILDIRTEQYGSILDDIIDKARRTGKRQGLLKDSFIDTPQNVRKYISASFSPILIEEKSKIVISFRDISQHKALEKENFEQKENSEAMINALPLGVIVIDSERHVIRVNDFISHNFGTFHPSLKEQYLGNILKCVNSRNNRCGLSDSCNECKVKAMIESLVDNNERYSNITHHMRHYFENQQVERDYEVGCVKLHTKNNDELMLIVHDITDQMLYEQHIRHEKEIAEDANRLKTEFLSKVSHEIRTPLNGIIGMVDLTKMVVEDEAVVENLAMIKSSSQELANIINKVLDISKIESGAFELYERPFSMGKLFDSIIEEQQLIPCQNMVTMKIEPWVHLQERFVGDERRIKQIITQLIDNSRKFTEKGSIRVFHNLYRDYSKDKLYYIELHVLDTGVGISETYQKRMYDSFTQDDGSYTRRVGGIGLGLAITKKILDQLGGVIMCNSTVDEGTDFYIRMPLLATEEKAIDRSNGFTYLLRSDIYNDSTAFENNVSKRVDILINDGGEVLPTIRKRVLLVEDDLINQKVIAKQLEKSNIEVVLAVSGNEALKFFESESVYDMIIMDIQLPEINGLEATDNIRKSARGKQIPIIALTSFTSAEDQETIMKHDFSLYMAKPVQLKFFSEEVERLLSTEYQNKSSNTKEEMDWVRGTINKLQSALISLNWALLESITEELHEQLCKMNNKEIELLVFKIKLQIRKENYSGIQDIVGQLEEILNKV